MDVSIEETVSLGQGERDPDPPPKKKKMVVIPLSTVVGTFF